MKKHAEDTALNLLQEKLRVIMNDTSDNMISGACRNFPEYTKLAGVIEGLALAERELLDLDDVLLNSP